VTDPARDEQLAAALADQRLPADHPRFPLSGLSVDRLPLSAVAAMSRRACRAIVEIVAASAALEHQPMLPRT